MNKYLIFDVILVVVIVIVGLWFFSSVFTDLGSGHQYSGDYPVVPERAN